MLGGINIDRRLRVRGVECVLTLTQIVSMNTDNSCKVVMYELFVFILINSTTHINIIIQSLYRKIIIYCNNLHRKVLNKIILLQINFHCSIYSTLAPVWEMIVHIMSNDGT